MQKLGKKPLPARTGSVAKGAGRLQRRRRHRLPHLSGPRQPGRPRCCRARPRLPAGPLSAPARPAGTMPRSFLVKKHFNASKKPNYSELDTHTGKGKIISVSAAVQPRICKSRSVGDSSATPAREQRTKLFAFLPRPRESVL